MLPKGLRNYAGIKSKCDYCGKMKQHVIVICKSCRHNELLADKEEAESV